MRVKRNGFTLFDLVVIVLALLVLSAVAVPLIVMNRRKAMHSEAIATASGVSDAARLYVLQTDVTPETFEDIVDTGMIDERRLEGTYFSKKSYGDWKFDSKSGRVVGFTVTDPSNKKRVYTWNTKTKVFSLKE